MATKLTALLRPSCFQPLKLGLRVAMKPSLCAMCSSTPNREKTNFISGYNGIPELKNASDMVKSLFSLEMAGKRDVRRLTQEGLSKKYTGKFEQAIAVYTMRIKSLLEHCQSNKQDKSNKVFFIWLIDQRKKVMKKLMKSDLQRYMDIVEELQIPPLRNSHDPSIKYKSRKFKINVPLKKKRELHEFETDRNY